MIQTPTLTALRLLINETDINYKDAIIHTDESFDLLPANISLSGADIQLSNVISRETIFKSVINTVKNDYDYILINNNPALNLFTINGLVLLMITYCLQQSVKKIS